jgi:hypothetical protein
LTKSGTDEVAESIKELERIGKYLVFPLKQKERRRKVMLQRTTTTKRIKRFMRD